MPFKKFHPFLGALFEANCDGRWNDEAGPTIQVPKYKVSTEIHIVMYLIYSYSVETLHTQI